MLATVVTVVEFKKAPHAISQSPLLSYALKYFLSELEEIGKQLLLFLLKS